MSSGCISKGEELPWRFLQLAGIDTVSRNDVVETQGKENIGVVSFFWFFWFFLVFSISQLLHVLSYPQAVCVTVFSENC